MRTRTLGPEEWDSVQWAELPPLFPFVRPEDIEVVAVEVGGEVVGTLTVFRAVHFEGLQIRPEHRNAGVSRALWRAGEGVARRWGASWAIGGAADDHMRGLCERLGVKLPMDVYALSLGRV